MKESGTATIKDVAKQAGVSTATVSHVINNTRYVSDQVKQRVHRAMDDLGYVSNHIAKALRGGATKTIGIIIPDISIPYFGQVVYAIEEQLRAAGYMMILCDSAESFDREKELIDHLCSYQVDGIILAPVNPSFDYIRYFNLLGRPVVFFDRYPNAQNYTGVFCNVKDASAQAVEMMIRRGHSRVALINRDTVNCYSIVRERQDGYLEALQRNGITPDPELIYQIPARSESGYAVMEELLAKRPDVNAVYSANRNISIGVFQCLRDHSIRIPQDMSIVGFSAHGWFSMTSPKLTCVLEPVQDLGHKAACLMLEKLQDPERPPERVILKAFVAENESV